MTMLAACGSRFVFGLSAGRFGQSLAYGHIGDEKYDNEKQ